MVVGLFLESSFAKTNQNRVAVRLDTASEGSEPLVGRCTNGVVLDAATASPAH